ncbi:MAG: crosslink repair DNA glycosylase YcaQ family protein [Alphaproteobacteria bacterium]
MSVESTPLRIAAADGRRLILALQGLAAPPRRRLDGDQLHALIGDLGYVQVDSIQWVERAHHMILASRRETYRPEHLRRLLEDEARLFENWTHDASIIPADYFPYWNRKFSREGEAIRQRFIRWRGHDAVEAVEAVIEHIRDHGPVMARDLNDAPTGKQRGWWDWHAGKTALEYLWRTGRVMIARRQGFQKVYELTERVLPAHLHGTEADHDAYVDWACRGALQRLGFGSPGDIARFWNLVTIDEAKDWCQRHLGREAVPVVVETADGSRPKQLLARPDIEALLADLPPPPPRLRALNPFDPVLRDRNRLNWLFGFDYRIEIFVPAPQRKYGYYIFPLLDGDRLIGRLDMKAERSADTLAASKLWLEPKQKWSAARQKRLEAELERQRKLVGLGHFTAPG